MINKETKIAVIIFDILKFIENPINPKYGPNIIWGSLG